MQIFGTVMHGMEKHSYTPTVYSDVITYTGNNTVNRALPHSLGRIPRLCVVYWSTGHLMIINNLIYNFMIDGYKSVTAANASYVYVGNSADYNQSANATGLAYTMLVLG